MDTRVAAIVPAYNEAQNIERVLDVLEVTPLLNEIIVVDDGSTDATAEIVGARKGVTLIRNKENKGKALSMDRGVRATDAPIIFFCDADLRGLTPEIVESIIRPVLRRQLDMFVAVLDRSMQKTVRLFGINSGQRALRREIWELLPESFKQGYRVEAGLNYIARKHGRGFGWQRFNFGQTIKEKKYGVWKGTVLRWKMNMDVLYVYLHTLF